MRGVRAETSPASRFTLALLSVSVPSTRSTRQAHYWAMPTAAVAISVAKRGVASSGSPGT